MIRKIMPHTLKNIRNMFHAVLPTKLFVLMIKNVASQLLFTGEKMQSIALLKQLLKSMIKKSD